MADKNLQLVLDEQVKILSEKLGISKEQALLRTKAFLESDIFERYKLSQFTPDEKYYQFIIDISMSIPQINN